MSSRRKRTWRKATIATTIALALAGASITGAQAYDATPGTVYELGSDPCLKGRGNCVIYPKSTQLSSGRLLVAFEKSTVAASGSAVGQSIPIMKSDDDGDTWQPLAEVEAPAFMSDDPAVAKYTSNWTNPYLYVLPETVGDFAAGTILLATVVSGEDEYYVERKAADPNWVPTNDGDRRDMALALYSSTDEGESWSFHNIIATGGWQGGSAGNINAAVSAQNTTRQVDPVWEPHLDVHDGSLVAYYSDENDYLGYDTTSGIPTIDPANATATDSWNQILVHKTWDGSSAEWSAPVVDVAGGSRSMGGGKTVIGEGRPGMTTIAKTTDGKWILTFEYFGGGSNVRYKISDDPLNFFADGDLDGNEISALPVESGSGRLSAGGSPVLTTLPDGRIVFNANGSGSVWINASGASTGQWVQYQTTVGGGYSRTLQYVEDTGRLLILHATWGGATAGSVIQRAHVDVGASEGAYYQLVNRKTGQVIGTSGHSNDANLGGGDVPDVRLENAVAGDATQLWHLATKRDGKKTLLNASGGRAAAIWTGNPSVGQRLGQWVDEGSAGLWNLIDTGDGHVKLQAAGNTSVYATGSTAGAHITLQNAATDGSQDWMLVQQAPDAAALKPSRSSAGLVDSVTVAAGSTIELDAATFFASGAPRHASSTGTVYLLDDSGNATNVAAVSFDAQQRGSVTLPDDLAPGADLQLAVLFDEAPLVWDAVTVDESSVLPVASTVLTRCAAGKVVLAVTTRNDGTELATGSVESTFGSRTFAAAAGKSAVSTLATRATAVDSGSVSVTVSVADESATYVVPFAGRSCS